MKTSTLFSLLFSLVVCGSLQASVLYDRVNVTDIPGTTVHATPNDGLPDTTGINAAISYTFPGSNATKSIYFPAGIYIYDGPMTLTANTSIRLYGDGPGVSIIIFTGTNPGITAAVGSKTLQIEGLTLQATVADTGTAISATFDRTGLDAKFRTATIRNVQIIGSSQIQNPTGYWKYGIDLNGAPNALIDDVQINGSYTGEAPLATDAIHYHAPPNSTATQLFVTNLHVSYYKTAVRTSGPVEGLYMSGFELVFCGSATTGAMELTATRPNGDALPVFHIMNGHINQLFNGVKLNNLLNVKFANVNFFNIYGTGTHLEAINCSGVNVTGCEFIDFVCSEKGEGCTPITAGNGIYLHNTIAGKSVSAKIIGNNFALQNPDGGQAILVSAGCSRTMIFDNDFSATIHTINDQAATGQTVTRLITFP